MKVYFSPSAQYENHPEINNPLQLLTRDDGGHRQDEDEN